MPAAERKHVEVYVLRKIGRVVEHLCLRRAKTANKLPGVWQPVTGKVELLEQSLEAAIREVREETGLTPIRWWALETVSTYYDSADDSVRHLPLFAAEVEPGDSIVLSREHDDHAWLGEQEFAARVLWEMQRRALEAVRREVLTNPRLAEALDVTEAARRWQHGRHPKTAPRAKAKSPRARRTVKR